MKDRDTILLAHGAGGRLTHAMVREMFLPVLDNPYLNPLSDAAVLPELPPGRPALTTDAFVVDPPVFPGGDLGYLSVCGTVNDLAVSGARPLWLTWALILEEGTDRDLVATCVEGAARAAREAEVKLVAGDTKVVPRGKGDRIFAATTGLGVVPEGRETGDGLIRPGDALLASGYLGDHGATIMACRHGLSGEDLRSDAAPLGGAVEALFQAGLTVRSMHDPTRGGLTSLCHETAERSGLMIRLQETGIPVRPAVRTVCEMLGLDPYGLACEGRFIVFLPEKDVEPALDLLRREPGGEGAARIGTVSEPDPRRSRVVLETALGSERPLDFLSGSNLPRIC